MESRVNMNKLEFYVDNECSDVSDFQSGYDVFDEFIKHRYDESVIHYILESKTDKLVAYFALVSTALPYGTLDNLSGVPAIELKMFALDRHYQGMGLSNELLTIAIEMIEHFVSEYVGAKIILLYSVPVGHVIKLYEDKGFQRVKGPYMAFKSQFTEGCIPMFKVI